MFLFTSIVLYAIALQFAYALPVMKRIVINPSITMPNANTVWNTGSTQLVTWYDDLRLCQSVHNLPT